MLSGEEIKNRFEREGYSLVHKYNDPPNEEFPDHDHEGDQLLIVMKGSIVVQMAAKEYLLQEGDELLFPAKLIHSAKVGPEGCEYMVGEKK